MGKWLSSAHPTSIQSNFCRKAMLCHRPSRGFRCPIPDIGKQSAGTIRSPPRSLSDISIDGGEDGTRSTVVALGSADSGDHSAVVVLPIAINKKPCSTGLFCLFNELTQERRYAPARSHRSRSRMLTITANVKAVTTARVGQLIPCPNHQSSAQHIKTGTTISRFIASPFG